MQVNRLPGLPASGASQGASQRWLVLLNASEPRERQRFSLAHELKHIVDHRFADLIYGAFPVAGRKRMVEQLCDYFAACLLMPRTWVKNAWCGGVQHTRQLAKFFDVSDMAMQVRLSSIGLTDPIPRCLEDWTAPTPGADDEVIYQGSAKPRFALVGQVL